MSLSEAARGGARTLPSSLGAPRRRPGARRTDEGRDEHDLRMRDTINEMYGERSGLENVKAGGYRIASTAPPPAAP